MVSISNKMAGTDSEIVLFSWYLIPEILKATKEKKMGSLRIEKSQPVTTNSKLNFRGNKSGFNWENYEAGKKPPIKFYGKESFDYHDLNNFTLKDMFSGSYGNKKVTRCWLMGTWVMHFDNASQIVVDSFLRVYFDNF